MGRSKDTKIRLKPDINTQDHKTDTRLAVIAAPIVYFYMFILDFSMYGVWFGIKTGNFIAAVVSFIPDEE